MARLIDSSIFIAQERRRQPIEALFEALSGELSAMASITASELLVGVHRAEPTRRRLQREANIESIIRRIPVLPFELRAARVHAEIWAQLATSGLMIGAHDLIIAATAIANGYAVLTDNVREFQRVPGLVVEQPAW